MLQRIQTLFLLLAAIAMICLFFIPFKTFSMGGVESELLITDKTFLMAICIAVTAIIGYNIINFKNRPRQIALGFVTTLFLFGLLLGLFLLNAPEGAENVGSAAGILLPMAALIFNNLAVRFIWKDEKLVRGSERLR